MSRIKVEQQGSVALVTLNDPDRRNALGEQLNEELIDAIRQCEEDPDIVSIVLTGASPAFCAGADLGQLGSSRREGLERIYQGFMTVAQCSLPTIAAVNGAAVGAGMNLALACDLRVCGESARFDTRFLSLGIHPGGGHTWMMRQTVGLQRTMAMVLFGETVDGIDAERAGLAWRCVSDDQLAATALDLATAAGRGGRELALRTKATIRGMGSTTSHSDAVDRELDVQLWSMDQPEFAERLASLRATVTKRTKPST